MTLTEAGIWITVGFVSGSVPWSLILTSTISGKGARKIGDGNPGATNAWIMAGWRVGVPSMAFDVGKSAIPVWLALGSLEYANSAGDHFLIATIAISPIIGHAWSPLLRFKGGKALAPSWGSWIAITTGFAFPVALVILGLMHLLQKNHAITVTVCLVGFMVVFIPIIGEKYIFFFGSANLALVAFKHRGEYLKSIVMRNWVRKLSGDSA